MLPIVRARLAFAVSLVRSRVSLQVEILALRHQRAVSERASRRTPSWVWTWATGGATYVRE